MSNLARPLHVGPGLIRARVFSLEMSGQGRSPAPDQVRGDVVNGRCALTSTGQTRIRQFKAAPARSLAGRSPAAASRGTRRPHARRPDPGVAARGGTARHDTHGLPHQNLGNEGGVARGEVLRAMVDLQRCGSGAARRHAPACAAPPCRTGARRVRPRRARRRTPSRRSPLPRSRSACRLLLVRHRAKQTSPVETSPTNHT